MNIKTVKTIEFRGCP